MLGEKRSGDIFGPGPKRETGGQEAMAGEAVNSPKVEPQNEHELRQKKEQVVIPERQPDSDGMSLVEIDRAEEEAGERLLFQESQYNLGLHLISVHHFIIGRFPAPTICSFPHREKAGSLRMF